MFRCERYELHQSDMARLVSACGNVLSKKGKTWQLVATLTTKHVARCENPPTAEQKWQKNGKLGEFMPNFRLTLLTKL
ncbi:MAG TPA: hypothetical protein DEP33_14005 [Alteromonas sp.]|nr:hypothetical protein [Alteromonas sp.]